VVIVIPEPGASRLGDLRQSLVEHTRWLVALEKSIVVGQRTEARLARLFDDELRQTRGPGRPYELDRLDAERRMEQIRTVLRLSVAGASVREIARETELSRRQVENIVGVNEAA
jgi:DNA-binding NarL/FixJ family response regulator